MHTIKLEYSAPEIKRTIRVYFLKKVGYTLPLVTALLFVFVAYRVVSGDRSWLVGATGAVAVLATLFIFVGYFAHLNRSLARLRRMKVTQAKMELHPEYFRVVSDVGVTELKWSHVSELQRFRYGWLIFLQGSDILTIPVSGLSDESKSLIVEHVRNGGTKIT